MANDLAKRHVIIAWPIYIDSLVKLLLSAVANVPANLCTNLYCYYAGGGGGTRAT